MRILFIGDIVGSPGRRIVADRLADIVSQEAIDLVLANGENSASGFGITPRLAEELFATGIEVLTGGNHIWDRKELLEYIPQEPRLLASGQFSGGNARPGSFYRHGAKRRPVRSVESARARVHGFQRLSIPRGGSRAHGAAERGEGHRRGPARGNRRAKK